MKATGMSKAGRNALGAAVAAALVPASASAAVGRIDFAYGDVVGVSPAGQERKLVRGAQIEEGDTIVTRRGRAQIRFTDGARTSLLPNSEFRVDRYEYEEQKEEESTGLFSLLRGGLRTITGAIGRLRKEAYQVTTPSATIGIRGTEYLAVIGDSLTVWVAADGAIVLKNDAGQKTFEGGTTAYVKNNDTLAIVVDGKPYLFSYLGNDALLDEFIGNNLPFINAYIDGFVGTTVVGENGVPNVVGGRLVPIIPEPPEPPAPPLFEDGPLYALSVAVGDSVEGEFVAGAPIPPGTPLVNGTFNGATLLSYASTTLSGDIGTATAVETGGDGIVGWGRWTDGIINTNIEFDPAVPLELLRDPGAGGESHHYAIGIPTAEGAFPTGNASYDLLGATSPTYSEQTSPAGVVNSASLVANFDSGSVNVLMNFTIGVVTSQTYDMNAPATMGTGANRFEFGASGFYTVNAPGGGFSCSGGCDTRIKGFFAGDQAARAGLTYHVDLDPFPDGRNPSRQVTGAAAFTKN